MKMLKEIELRNIELNDNFWKEMQNKVKEITLPYQFSVLNDDVKVNVEAERKDDNLPSGKSHAIENFRITAGITLGEHFGWVFQDTDVYKWIESVAYFLMFNRDNQLERSVDEVVDIIEKAQEADGYLNTYYQCKTPQLKYRELHRSHELYCAGHLIEANDNFYFSKSLLIRDVKKWSPECPELYKVKLEIITIDRISSCEIITGFRTISFSSQTGFQLNDKNVKLKGVCLHEDSGVLGTAVPGIVWVRRLIKLKELGCNAIRMSHNPHSTILYELCDLMGFLVIDEAFDEWENTKNKWWQGHNVYPPKYEGYASDFPNWHEYDLKDMIVRNRNRPSIIAWSIGNEIDYPNDPYANPLFEFMTGNNDASKPEQERIYNPTRPNTIRLTQIAKKLHNIVKKYDTTRPTTLAAAFPELSAQTGLTQVVDIIGYNYKEEYYEEHHAQFPDLPLFGSENGHGYNQWQIVAKSKYIFGQFLWTGIDYLGEAHGWPIHGSGAGLLTLAGYEKNKYFARKSWWSTTPMIRLYSSPINKKEDSYSRNWNYEFGTSVCIKCYTNSNSPELFLGQTKIDLIYNKFEGCFETEISYTGENLTAKIDGAEDVLEQVGAPAKIKAEFWDDEEISCLSGNFGVSLDKDVKQLEVYLLDQNDRQTLEERMIEVLGNNIELLGIENGNLSDVQSYRDNSRRTFEGKLIIFIRKTAKESEIVLRSKYLPDLHLDF